MPEQMSRAAGGMRLYSFTMLRHMRGVLLNCSYRYFGNFREWIDWISSRPELDTSYQDEYYHELNQIYASHHGNCSLIYLNHLPNIARKLGKYRESHLLGDLSFKVPLFIKKFI